MFLPIDDSEEVTITPDLVTHPHIALDWLAGEEPIAAPPNNFSRNVEAWGRNAEPLLLFRGLRVRQNAAQRAQGALWGAEEANPDGVIAAQHRFDLALRALDTRLDVMDTAIPVSVQHKILSGTYTPPSAGQVTVEGCAAEWTGRRHWRAATADRIERELRLHILPTLGQRPLASLRRSQIEEWATTLSLAPSSVEAVAGTLTAMLSAAVEDERIPRNPASGALHDVAGAMPEHMRAAGTRRDR